MKSLIRQLLLEAEDVSLNREPVAAAPTSGMPMSDADFPAAPAEPAPGLGGGTPTMPTPSGGGSSTIQKNVIDKEVIKAITVPLKSLVSSFEKIFDSNDFTTEQARPHIDQFLTTLASFAEGISKIGGGGIEPEEAPMPEAMPEEPSPEAMPEAPMGQEAMPPAPEGGMGGMGGGMEGGLPGGEEMPQEGGQEYTNPWGGYEDEYTNPNEATQ